MFKAIFKSTAVGLINKAIAAIGTFLIFPLMLKKMGVNNFGIWMTISSSVGLMSIMDLGIGNTLMNYIAWNRENQANVTKYIKTAYMLQFGFIGSIIILLLFIFNHINWGGILNVNKLTSDIKVGILITVVLFLLSLVTNSIYSIQRGMQNNLLANQWQLGSTLLYLLLIWLVLQIKPNIKFVAIVNFGVPVFISLLNTGFYFYKERDSFTKPLNLNRIEIKSFINSSSILFFIQIAALIAFETDCLILAHYLNYTEVAKFTIIAKLYSVPTILLNVYFQNLWPAYANAFGTKQWLLIRNTFKRSILATIVVTVLFIIVTMALKDYLLRFWLAFPIQIPTSLFIAFSCWIVISNIDSNISAMLNGLNKLKVQLFLAVFMVTTNLMLSIIFVKKWGVQGVVWGSVISTLAFSVIPFLFYIKSMFNKFQLYKSVTY